MFVLCLAMYFRFNFLYFSDISMKTPVLDIHQFKSSELLKSVYVNTFSKHMDRNKELITKPHTHNFYLCVVFTKGHGVHEIDFRSYEIKPGVVFLMKPGQTHHWEFDDDPEGYIFFHSREFYEMTFVKGALNSFPFYYSFQNPPLVHLPENDTNMVEKFENLYDEYTQSQFFRELKIASIINEIYIDLSRVYTSNIDFDTYFPARYLTTLERFEQLINTSFREQKLPKYYADELNITTRHLHRVLKETVNKTPQEMIAEKVIIEAKKLIVKSDDLLVNISDVLGFSDYSYFSKYFKVRTGITPLEFRKKYSKKG